MERKQIKESQLTEEEKQIIKNYQNLILFLNFMKTMTNIQVGNELKVIV